MDIINTIKLNKYIIIYVCAQPIFKLQDDKKD